MVVSGWLGHLSTGIFFVIPGVCADKIPECRVCVTGTLSLPTCTACQDGNTLDSQTNECKRKSLSVCLSLCLPVCLSVCLSVYLSVYLSVCLSVCFHCFVCESGVTFMYMFSFGLVVKRAIIWKQFTVFS